MKCGEVFEDSFASLCTKDSTGDQIERKDQKKGT